MSIEYPINVSTPDYDMLTWQYLIGFGNRFKDFRTTDLGFTQDRMGDIMKIDYMMCSPTLTPLTYHLADTPWSDHKIQIGTIDN